MAQEKPGQTLQATALVHEAYIRLVDTEQAQHWDSRRHFFAAAVESMRRILVENARRRKLLKRGGNLERLGLEAVPSAEDLPDEELLALCEALQKLASKHPKKAELVQLRYFGGFLVAEAAAMLGISTATAERHWKYSRAWLSARTARRVVHGIGLRIPEFSDFAKSRKFSDGFRASSRMGLLVRFQPS